MIDTRLDGRNVLITGGAGNIGAAIGRAFAAQGARVAVHYLAQDPPAPEGTEWAHATPGPAEAEALARELGNGSFAVSADLARPDAARRLVAAVAERLGTIDVLVNNAAHCETPDTVDTLTPDSLERHYRVNAIAPALLTAEAARLHDPTGRCASSTSRPTPPGRSPGRSATGPRRPPSRPSPGPPRWTWPGRASG